MRTVRVLDRWGNDNHPVVVSVEIDDVCPECKGPRGIPDAMSYPEGDKVIVVDAWSNPCGHLDHYSQVLVEAGVHRMDERMEDARDCHYGKTYAEVMLRRKN